MKESDINRGHTNVHVSTRRYDEKTGMAKISQLLRHSVICEHLGVQW